MAFPEDHAQHSISHDGEEDGDRFVWRLPIYQPPTRQPLLSPNRAKNQKEGAAVEDILYELLLKFGQDLTTPIETQEVAGGKVFAIHDRKMIFVLQSFTEAMIVPLLEMKPREIIAIDGVFNESDMLKTNLDLQCRDAGIRFTCL